MSELEPCSEHEGCYIERLPEEGEGKIKTILIVHYNPDPQVAENWRLLWERLLAGAKQRLHASRTLTAGPDLIEQQPTEPEQLKECVYLLRSADGAFKIGVSRNPENRTANISRAGRPPQVKRPFRLLHQIECARPYTLEAQLKRRFADKCILGEWFRLTLEDVAYIKTLAGSQEAA